MRRICCFCELWESGGIESFLSNTLLNMDLTDMQVDIVASSIKKSIFTNALKDKGVHFIELSGAKRKLRNLYLFRKQLKTNNYDVVHLNLYQGWSLVYVLICKLEHVPRRIAHSHSSALRKSKGLKFKLLLHGIGKCLFSCSATELWSCSEEAARFLFAAEALKKRSFEVIPNGIDVKKFYFQPLVREKVRADLGLQDSFVIGNVGRLSYQKNQIFLLDVLSEIIKEIPNTKLLLIGDGEQKAYLVKKAESLGVINNVVFYGTSEHIEKFLCAMDAFAFPSCFEGFGIAAIEAQASGLQVLCSDRIPKEAVCTQLCKRMPLEKAKWIAELECVRFTEDSERSISSKNAINSLKETFDVTCVSNRIREAYSR